MTAPGLDQPVVLVLALGGTIASTDEATGSTGVAPSLDGADLVAAVPELEAVARVDARTLRALPGPQLDLADVLAAVDAIHSAVEAGAAGVVVTQGTDTIEDTAFLLDLLVEGPAPVVVTGALRHPGLVGADGPANLLAAVTVAAWPGARGLGCLVVLNDEIHAARFVTKAHTSNPAAFVSFPGALGWLAENRPRMVLHPVGRAPHLRLLPGAAHRVGLVALGMGDDGTAVTASVASGVSGMVIEALGGGHIPPGALEAVRAAAAQMPVVVASTTRRGEVLRSTYDFAGSEIDLARMGVTPGGWLRARQARLLLTMLLRSGAARHDITATFADPYR